MKALWIGLLLWACGSPTDVAREGTDGMASKDASAVRISQAEEAYRSCVRAEAARIGTRATISAEQADRVVARCRRLLRPAALQRAAEPGRMTNLPAGMETEEGRISTAMTRIEHAAKMEISDDVLPLPVP